MALGKSGIQMDIDKLSIKFGDLFIIQGGKLSVNYTEDKALDYMKSDTIDISIEIGNGSKNFTAYTMDLTKKYIEINTDYRS